MVQAFPPCKSPSFKRKSGTMAAVWVLVFLPLVAATGRDSVEEVLMIQQQLQVARLRLRQQGDGNATGSGDVTVEATGGGAAGPLALAATASSAGTTVPALPASPKLSVVLACANEGEYAVKTATKVYDRTPSDVLEEVIVVDDGSDPPLTSTFDDAGVDAGARKR